MPAFHSLEEADIWRAENCRAPKTHIGKKTTAPENKLDLSDMEPAPDGLSFDELMVWHAEQVPIAAHRLYLQAVEAKNDAQVSVRIKNWGEASKQAAAVREKFIALQEESGQLLPMDIMLDVVTEIFGSLVYAIDTMGERYATKANPENPEIAKTALEAAADEIKMRVSESDTRIQSEVINRRDSIAAKTKNNS